MIDIGNCAGGYDTYESYNDQNYFLNKDSNTDIFNNESKLSSLKE